MLTEYKERIRAAAAKGAELWKKYGCMLTSAAVWSCIFLLSIGILATGIRLINSIRGQEEKSCYIMPDILVYYPVEDRTYSVHFQAVSKALNHLDVWIESDESSKGTFSYEIQDEAGTMVKQEAGVDVRSSLNETGSHIQIDVSDAGLEHGGAYDLTLCFDSEGTLGVALAGEELLIEQYYSFTYGWLLTAVIVVIGALTVAGMFLCARFGMDWKLFAGLALGVGFILILIMPPAYCDDEYRHFIRAYDLARTDIEGSYELVDGTEKGNLFAGEDGRAAILTVPEEISELRLLETGETSDSASYFGEINTDLSLDKLFSILKNPESAETARVSETATIYRGWGDYGPQVIFVKLGTMLGMRSIFLYYMARVGQLICCVLLALLALWLAPEFKHLIWAAYFLPEAMILRSSCNPDGLMMGEIILFIAYILHLRLRKKEVLSPIRLLILAVLLYSIFHMKPPYGILCMASIFLLKQDNFKIMQRFKAWQYRKYIGIGVLLCAAAGIAAVLVLGGGKKLATYASVGYLSPDHVDYIFENPVYVAKLFLFKGWDLFQECLVYFRGDFYISYLAVSALALVFCKKRLGIISKIYSFLVLGGMMFIVVLAGYSLTPPDYGAIWGITYRYILPVMPLACLIPSFGTEATEEAVSRIYPIFVFAILGGTCMMLIPGFVG